HALAERRARQEEREGRSGEVEAATKRDPEEPARSPLAPTPPPTAWEIPAAPPDERLRVVAGSTYLLKQETKMHRQRTALGTLLFGLLAAGVLVGLAPLVAAILRPGAVSIAPVMAGLLLEVVVWLATPHVQEVRDAWKNFKAGRLGEERLTALLQQHLSENWVLFRNVVLPQSSGDIDAVLVGPRGVFALEVKAYSGEYRNAGEIWQRRAYGLWRMLERNPTRQARRNAVTLSKYLERRGIDVWVEPRVVWAGDSRIWLEKPAVRVWKLSDPTYLLEDIESQRPLSEDVVRATVSALEAANQEDEDVDQPR
ncbi:MAG: nuclease-related domain-containing protein, partial [Anaerolineae bacterium]